MFYPMMTKQLHVKGVELLRKAPRVISATAFSYNVLYPYKKAKRMSQELEPIDLVSEILL